MHKYSEWQKYVDDGIMNNANISKAGIFGFGLKGTEYKKWASNGLDVNPDELKIIGKSFVDPHFIVAHGIPIDGTKYIYRNSDSSLIIGGRPHMGCCILKCRRCIIVVIFDDPQSHATNVVNNAMKIADYLRQHGY